MAEQPALAEKTKIGGAVKRPEFIAMLAGLMALNALAIDIMLPAFPAFAREFNLTDENHAQFVILAYSLGFGAGQLFFGPISDRFGRRAPLFFGCAIYIICAIVGAIAPTFGLLLAARVLQGMGAAATRVVALSSVRDSYRGREMASIMSLVMMVFMTIPILAPLLGQACLFIGDWTTIFLFIAFLGIAMTVWSYARLPETLPEERRRPLTLASVAQGFGLVLSNRISLFYLLAQATFFGTLFAYLTSAQQIYVEIYDLDEWFPLMFGFTAIMMAVTSFANSRFVVRFGQRRMSHTALLVLITVSAALSLFAWAGDVTLWGFALAMCLTLPMIGWVGANFNSIAMEPLGAVAGTAASVFGFAQTAGGSFLGSLVGQAYNGTILPFSVGFLVLGLVSLSFVLIAEKGRLFGTGEDDAST